MMMMMRRRVSLTIQAWIFQPLISGCLFTARSMFTSLSLSTVYNVIHFIYFNSNITQLQREHILKAVKGKVGFGHGATLLSMRVNWFTNFLCSLKGLVHDNAHARRLSLQNKFVGSTLNSKSPLPVQSLKILRFIRTSVALAGLVILR